MIDTRDALLCSQGYIIEQSVIPEKICTDAVLCLNKNPDEFYTWKDTESIRFRNWVQNFLTHTYPVFNGYGAELQVFNRYTGGVQWWHDDNSATYGYPVTGPRRIFVCCYLTDTRNGGGALKIIPDSHLGGYKSMRTAMQKVYKNGIKIPQTHDYNGETRMQYPELFNNHPSEITLNVPAGSIIAVDERMIHRTEINTRPERRTMVLWWLHL